MKVFTYFFQLLDLSMYMCIDTLAVPAASFAWH